MSGTVFGMYGSYVATHGFWIDGVVNGNWLNLEDSVPSLPLTASTTNPSADMRSVGAQVEAGWRMGGDEGFFWEPLASLAYVKTKTDNLDMLGVAGATVDFDDATSFRGSLGLRIGTTTSTDNYKIRYSLTGRIWDEFDGDNQLNIISAGPNLPLSDDFSGTFGEVTGGLSLTGAGGHLSAFINGGVKFKDDYKSPSVTAGFRYQW
jgi:outer membrane autotransporter protein